MRFGQGDFVYELVEGWGKLPEGWAPFSDVVCVRVDADDRVIVFNRSDHPVIIFDRDGNVVGSWGEGVFDRPHGLALDPEGNVWTTDDLGHAVRKFSPDGTPLMVLGTPGHESDTGWTGDYDALRGGAPFNRPTNIAVSASGDIYVSDGYGNCKVHRFAADGTLIQSWGSAGNGQGQFRLPHGAWVEPENTVLIGDRMNDRIQRFSADGQFISEWSDVLQPNDFYRDANGIYYVAELGKQDGTVGDLGARVTVRNRDGAILSAWGDEGDPEIPGNMAAPHGICVDSRGDLYLGEVTYTGRISKGQVAPGTHVFQKFRRV